MLNKALISIFTILTFLSCTREVEPVMEEYDQKLVINSELQPDKPIYLFFSTSVGLISKDAPFQPTETTDLMAKIIVDGKIEDAESISYFEKEEEDGGTLTWRTRRSFRPVAGQEFELSAELLMDNEIIPISAKQQFHILQ